MQKKRFGTIALVIPTLAIYGLLPTAAPHQPFLPAPHAASLTDYIGRTVSREAAVLAVAMLLLAIGFVLRSHVRSPRLLRRDAIALAVLGLLYVAAPGIIAAGHVSTQVAATTWETELTPWALAWITPSVVVIALAELVTLRRRWFSRQLVEQTLLRQRHRALHR